ARTGGDFDALNHGFLTSLDASIGVVENLQIGASVGYFVGGDFVSAERQPDAGRWGFPFGAAYSRFLTSHLTIDASVLYTFRLQRDDFRIGSRIDAGV